MNMNKAALVVVGALVAVSAAAPAVDARERIRIVGSSTVFPFSTAVAEQFGRTTRFGTPVVESTGTGGGMKLFCAGIGEQYPDMINASRRIKESEVKNCAQNGVTDITEIKIGFDGIVVASAKAAPLYEFSLRQIFLALAKEVPVNGEMAPNPHQTWKDVDASLPDTKIEVLGPPPTSGTRDAFAELALEGGCATFDEIKALERTDGSRYKAICHTVREDGAYVEAGENDNLIVQKLEANLEALGIFGFSFLESNADKVRGSTVDGVEPTLESIASGDYPVSRSMYFYVKNAHVAAIPGIKEYLDEFTSEKAWGDYGYLTDKGLIPLPAAERHKWREKAAGLAPLGL